LKIQVRDLGAVILRDDAMHQGFIWLVDRRWLMGDPLEHRCEYR